MREIGLAATRLAEVLEGETPQEFPWRNDGDPFRVMLAEMMLVRTRADLVAPVYRELVHRWPEVAALAAASDEDVEAVLLPLGLPQRIPFFRKAAQHLLDTYGGAVPADRKQLERIPGVGRYTAEAVLAFAYGQAIVPVDVNVLRWAARVTGRPMSHATKGSAELRSVLADLAPLGGRKAYKLLDFTRLVCRARKPRCGECPVRDLCEYGGAPQEDVG